MSKLTVEDTSLVSVADAIRTKGGTTDALTFPDGFVSAIEGIQSGGGGGENYLPGFVDGSLTEITADMLAGCTSIRKYAFYNYKTLTSIVMPEGITSIEQSAFQNSSVLANIVFPESLTIINSNAFMSCIGLTSIVFPKNVTTISNTAFNNCYNINTIEMKPETPPKIYNATFANCSKLTTIIVPAGSLSAYKSATNWSAYADLMVEALS